MAMMHGHEATGLLSDSQLRVWQVGDYRWRTEQQLFVATAVSEWGERHVYE